MYWEENLAFYASVIRRIIPVEDVLTTLSPMQAEDMLGDNRYSTSDSPGKNRIIKHSMKKINKTNNFRFYCKVSKQLTLRSIDMGF